MVSSVRSSQFDARNYVDERKILFAGDANQLRRKPFTG